MVICVTLASGILSLPRIVAEEAGRDGWLSVLLGGIAMCAFAWFIWLLCKRFPTKSLPELSMTILGKPMGILVSIVFALYVFGVGGIILRIFIELISTWVFIWTPPPVLLLGFLVPAVYASRMGAMTLGRLTEIITMVTACIMLLWLVPLSEFSILNLRPVGAEGIAAIASGAQEAFFSFLGVEVILVFFPLVREKKKVLQVTLQALGAVTVLYMGITILTYGVLGVEHTVMQKWPLMSYLRIGTLPFVQRIDALFLFFWSTLIMTKIAIQYYAGTFVLATLTGSRYHDIWALGCWPLLYLVAIAPQGLTQIFKLIELTGRWAFIGVLSITALMLLVAKIRGLDESEKG